MKRQAALLLLGACLILHRFPAAAGPSYGEQTDDGQVLGYESIISQLNREVERPMASHARVPSAPDALDSVWFHFGVGGSAMTEDLTLEDGTQTYLGLKGLQISGGIDLFSANWMAEGTLRNFGQGADHSATQISLQEFELKLIYRDRVNRQFGFHVGGGLSARYLAVEQPGKGSKDYSTPTSLATGGIDFFLGERLSLGLEAAARDAIVAETIDHNSFDATLRVDLQL